MHIFKQFLFFCFLSFNCSASLAPEFYSLFPVLSQLPEWNEEAAQIEPIAGGQTNHNFKLILPEQTYFIRMGSDAPGLLGLSSKREYECTYLASQTGFAPPVALYAPEAHIMITPFIESRPIQLNNPSTLKRMIATIKQCHLSGIVFPTLFCPYTVIDDYHHHALNVRPSDKPTLGFQTLKIVEDIKSVIPEFKTSCPCHLDLYSQNFLDDGKKIWMIDWEYSAMGDPLYDLATFLSANYLSAQEMKSVYELYADHPTVEEFAYLYLMTILVDIRWGFWCLIQAEVSTIDSNYEASGEFFFERTLIKASSPLYQEALDLMKYRE